ncbi:MAG: hypothetical protein M1831_001409 [Alyxoria varia]|nr:MAG: hypothetical protein M1831_001409 [Alyxoria varia]
MLFTYFIPIATLVAKALCQTRSTGPITDAPPTPTGGVSPSQTREFRAALSSYFASFRDTQQYSNLALNIGLNVDGSVVNSITRSPLGLIDLGSTFDLRSFATDPPLDFPTQSWESELPGTVGDEYKSLQTSVALEAASIGQSVVGVSTNIPTAQATPTAEGAAPAMVAARPTGAAAVMGAVGLAAGVAAIAL